MTKSKKRVMAAITVIGSFALWLGLAEVVLRFLPVATGIRSSAESSANSVFRFVPNRDFVFSKRWDMIMANRGHVNNAGFVNDQDYRKDDPTPLIAVVGDSFIEAAMVPFGETLHGRLAAKLAGDFRVYSFAASAAPLSQYVVWARHAAPKPHIGSAEQPRQRNCRPESLLPTWQQAARVMFRQMAPSPPR